MPSDLLYRCYSLQIYALNVGENHSAVFTYSKCGLFEWIGVLISSALKIFALISNVSQNNTVLG